MTSRGRSWLRSTLVVLAVGSLALAAMALGRCGAEPAGASAGQPSLALANAAERSVTFAAVGDSITNADSPDFAGLRVGEASWVRYAVGPGLEFAGGWARGGARTADMAAAARPVRADVLVVISGTNDLAHGVPFDAIAANIAAIAETVGATRVLVSAIPPRDDAPGVAEEFNRQLEPFVAAQGWTFVDAMADLRDGEKYAAGMSDDGLHPSRRAAEILGRTLAPLIVASTAGAR